MKQYTLAEWAKRYRIPADFRETPFQKELMDVLSDDRITRCVFKPYVYTHLTQEQAEDFVKRHIFERGVRG